MSPRRSRRLVRQERKLPAKLLEEDSAAVCCFCKKAQSSIVCDKLLNGKITAHFYCLLFSSGLQQRGDVGGPLMGFLEADIMIELRRGSKLRCVYCKKQGATLGCCIKMCKKVFHVDCGNASDCLLQFYGDYRAYCPYHRPHQRIRPKESGSTSCLICACDMVSEPSPQVLVTPCCQHSFHRACLQAQASSAGSYFFKCCTCNNIDAFQKEMLDHGICIPEQDASWEREQGAYQDLLYRYQRCDAERCRCPMGREASSEESGDWEVITCSTCGSQGIHKACGNLSREALQRANSWVCVQCRKTLSLTEKLDTADWVSTPLVRKGEPKTGASNIAGEAGNGTIEKSTSSADRSAKAAAEPPDREAARLPRKRKADQLRGVSAPKRSANHFASSASVREPQHEGHESDASETSMQETGETRRPKQPTKSKECKVVSSSRASESAKDGACSQSVSVETDVTKAVDVHSSESPSTSRPSTSTSVGTVPLAGGGGQAMISCRNGKLCAAVKPRFTADTFVKGAIEKTTTVATTSGEHLGPGRPGDAVLPIPPRMMQLLPPSDAATIRKPKPKPIPKKSSGVQLSLLSYFRQFMQHKSEREN
ncbi:G2/M phase-specific E3 ubiquitin-protein ligase isoform X2 [Ixodes scapularis]|uniref:G2/M phase-specific E3 ubiquitin-protein ligase isoform X2 n=1 Tax=Ixodes scapularis TaxID=6945 RepID=UPI001A9E151E|nr:G2/M phase-specific E3 ubiquitin-protein ligase isoform X2 [Ixodes scapularis]